MPRQMARQVDIAAEVGRPNLLVNGSFRIYQRPNNASPASGTFGPDRWQFTLNGSSTFASCSTGIMGGGAFIALNGTFTYNAGDGMVWQKIVLSDGNMYSLRNRPLSLSMQVYVTTAGATRIFISSDGTGGAYWWSPVLNTPNTYVTLTCTSAPIPIDATYVNAGLYMQGSTQFWMAEAMLVQG